MQSMFALAFDKPGSSLIRNNDKLIKSNKISIYQSA